MAFADVKANIARFNEIGDAHGRARRRLRRAHGGDGQAAGPPSTRPTAGTWTASSSQAMDALQCPDPDMPVNVLLRRRASSRGAVHVCCSRPPTCCCSTSPPTTWTPNPCCGWRSSCISTRAPCMAVTHDRYFLDNVAEWICEVDRGQPVPVQGQLLHVPGDQGRSVWRVQEASRMPSSPKRLARTSSSGSAAPRRRVRRRAAPVWSATTRWPPRPRSHKKLDFTEIQIPAGPRLGAERPQGRAPAQAVRRPCAHGRPVLRAAAQRHRRRDRPQRRGQVHPVQDDHGHRAAHIRQPEARRNREGVSYVDQGRAGIDGDKNVWEVVSGGLDYIDGRRNRGAQPRVRGKLRLQGLRPAEARGRALRWRAQPPEPGA